MKKTNLTFNLLTFNHPKEKLALYFTDSEDNQLTRIFHTQVPDEVVTHFGQQDNYYTSFDQPLANMLPVIKRTKPDRQKIITEEGSPKWKDIKNSAFTISLLKKYYNWQIHNWFKEKEILVKPNFIHDNQIWLSLKTKDDLYYLHEKFTVKVQIAKITNQPELVVSADGISKIFRASVADLMSDISVGSINWVVFNRTLCKYDELPDEGRQSLDKVYPVWNFKLRDDLNQPTEAPNRDNKYLKYLSHIKQFFTDYLNTPEFKAIIPIDSPTFISVHDLRLGRVNETSNQLMFGDGSLHNVPYKGMQQGPFKSSIYSKIQFFYIMHENDKDVALSLNTYFKEGLHSFRGLYNFARVPYLTKSNFSILFKDVDNPLPEIEREINDRSFDSETHYMAIYLSPHSKHTGDKKHKDIYFKVKQMLLKRDITSQTIEAEKVRQAVIQ
ncbi:MAG: hypothetical protein LHW64_12095, partial [Candidatus Cloacimonetes bacterium]|nr:hypothetical protein [Candidatus Cloacimonadota bacterium]MDY0230823.1 hypothetical protein [Candidatus Cloacimonadaceae bacterium]